VLLLLVSIAAGMIVVEKLWPAVELPRVRAWWARVIAVNAVQLGIVILAGVTWDRWLEGASLFHLRDRFGVAVQGALAYLVSTFVYYWWHRLRHESRWFWLLCHQLHHSPRRIELVTSFYKHPVEIALNSLLSAAIVYPLLGCSPQAGALYTFLTGIAEFFYHWNVNTPRWLGFVIQRPESHRVHHQYRHHTQNFADLPVWDLLFGTFHNPRRFTAVCGYDDWREDRFEDMLVARDVHAAAAETTRPFAFLPTCIGCSKRWACAASAGSAASAAPPAEPRS
jgi:sterol desaturase/sphingolipid hydroxylase (fatty acid hydroxylase superfamily)